MQIPEKALIYSSHEKIKIADLKKNIFTTTDTTKLKTRMQTHKIYATIKEENNHHFKFTSIKTPPYIIYYK
jgi:hypothetical protein